MAIPGHSKGAHPSMNKKSRNQNLKLGYWYGNLKVNLKGVQ
jgi:hypothetical protein